MLLKSKMLTESETTENEMVLLNKIEPINSFDPLKIANLVNSSKLMMQFRWSIRFCFAMMNW